MAEVKKKYMAYVEAARRAAKHSTMKMQHGAVLVDKNRIISYGFNYRVKNMAKKFSVHAEESAILAMPLKKFKDSRLKMYVVRVGPEAMRPSRPCPRCQRLIENFKCIGSVYYT